MRVLMLAFLVVLSSCSTTIDQITGEYEVDAIVVDTTAGDVSEGVGTRVQITFDRIYFFFEDDLGDYQVKSYELYGTLFYDDDGNAFELKEFGDDVYIYDRYSDRWGALLTQPGSLFGPDELMNLMKSTLN